MALRLHLGCGSTVVRGWENIDKSPNVYLARVPRVRRALAAVGVLTAEQAAAAFPPGIIRADVRNGLAYADASVEFVYSSHTIEHLSRWQALEVMRECRRVLVRGGVVRIATPDLAAVVADYTSGDSRYGPTPADSFMARLGIFQEQPGTRAQRLVARLLTAPHQWLYDRDSLVHLMGEAGFADPQIRSYRSGEIPDLELLEHRPDSLFVEGARR